MTEEVKEITAGELLELVKSQEGEFVITVDFGYTNVETGTPRGDRGNG